MINKLICIQLIFNTFNMTTRGTKIKEHTCISQLLEPCTLFHKQAECRWGTKYKKAYLRSVDKIVLWLYHSLTGLETMSVLLKEQRQKEVENGFLEQSCDTLWGPY